MAKLNVDVIERRDGEVTEITYDGVRYVVDNDSTPEVGDISFVRRSTDDLDEGSFYSVISVGEFVALNDNRPGGDNGWHIEKRGEFYDMFKRKHPKKYTLYIDDVPIFDVDQAEKDRMVEVTNRPYEDAGRKIAEGFRKGIMDNGELVRRTWQELKDRQEKQPGLNEGDTVHLSDGDCTHDMEVKYHDRSTGKITLGKPEDTPELGDFVVAKPGNTYGITNEDMVVGEVVEELLNGRIGIQVLSHKSLPAEGDYFEVDSRYFSKVILDDCGCC